MLLVYIALLIPFRVCFDAEDKSAFGKAFDMMIDLSFMIDIVLTFFSAYFYKEKLIIKKSKIASNYCRGWFWLDLMTTIPF